MLSEHKFRIEYTQPIKEAWSDYVPPIIRSNKTYNKWKKLWRFENYSCISTIQNICHCSSRDDQRYGTRVYDPFIGRQGSTFGAQTTSPASTFQHGFTWSVTTERLAIAQWPNASLDLERAETATPKKRWQSLYKKSKQLKGHLNVFNKLKTNSENTNLYTHANTKSICNLWGERGKLSYL